MRGSCDVVLVGIARQDRVAQRVVHAVTGGVLRLTPPRRTNGVHPDGEVAEVRHVQLLLGDAQVVVVEVQLQCADPVPVAALLVQQDVVLVVITTK